MHVTAIFSKLDLPHAVADHRRVLVVLRFVRSDQAHPISNQPMVP